MGSLRPHSQPIQIFGPKKKHVACRKPFRRTFQIKNHSKITQKSLQPKQISIENRKKKKKTLTNHSNPKIIQKSLQAIDHSKPTHPLHHPAAWEFRPFEASARPAAFAPRCPRRKPAGVPETFRKGGYRMGLGGSRLKMAMKQLCLMTGCISICTWCIMKLLHVRLGLFRGRF